MERTPMLRNDKIRGALAMWESMTTNQRDLNQLNLEVLPNLIKFNKEMQSLALRIEQPHASGPAGDQWAR